jgi:hypothetical protein
MLAEAVVPWLRLRELNVLLKGLTELAADLEFEVIA